MSFVHLTLYFILFRCLSLNQALLETLRAATWHLCPLSYRTPQTVWYPVRWTRETRWWSVTIATTSSSCKDNLQHDPGPHSPSSTPTSNPACDQLITSPIEKRIFSSFFFLFLNHVGGGTKSTDWLILFVFMRSRWQKQQQQKHQKNKQKTTKNNWCMALHMENKDVQKTSWWMYTRDLPSEKKKKKSQATGSFPCYSRNTLHFQCDYIVSCFFNMNIFLYLTCRVHLTLCLMVRAWYSAKVFVV